MRNTNSKDILIQIRKFYAMHYLLGMDCFVLQCFASYSLDLKKNLLEKCIKDVAKKR